jgi:hypothetical protein
MTRMQNTGPGRARRISVVAGAVSALVLALTPAVTQAAPAKLTGGAQTVSVTSSSITVAPKSAWSPGSYRIIASTIKSALKRKALKNAKRSAATTQQVVTLGGLSYTTKPYYYRVRAVSGGKTRYSAIRTVYLRPPTPTLRVVGSSTTGLALVWSGPTATRYVVIQAEDPTMSEGRRAVSLDSRQRQYTPLGLVPGTQYWFAVQAYNGGVASLRSKAVAAVAPAAGVTVRAMTYNIMRIQKDGTQSNGERIAPWKQRKPVAVSLIRRVDPDVLAIQEGSDWATGSKGPRQVDDLRASLGSSTYALARTEVPPTESAYFRTGRYILYKSSVFRAVGDGGHWVLGPGHFAAYQILEHLETRARVLAVSVHLESGNDSYAADVRRQAQARLLLSKVQAYLAGRPMPVFYLGDFNSHEKKPHALDGPGVVMRAAHIADADEVAPVTVNRTLNSANKYRRVAPRASAHVDHIYAPPGVGVRRFEIVANLTSGKFTGTIASDHNPVTADLVLPYPSS